ncbi:bifunctional nuclease family protein [Cellulomonas bogoriensis]|uniref:BFN domain-containing protein n=1 Tax=Cellulomonas bogoriensis 69B4 = DSM 16987 TaxID=1386082 RepID=A0A0A0BZN6_9CELL|nr:bifunctional nuclease family protein [Cellulomonas bogoriensis]KGM13405.1 hypothetical protein N869_14350 [Cellulomonas bogoriensis 69B4 = DSM 16987]
MRQEDRVQVEVLGVRRQGPGDQVVVLLLDVEGRRLLPVVVGVAEGSAIATAQAGVLGPRPMTHDLLVSVLEATGRTADRVEIHSLVDGVFHASLVLDDGTVVDSRASDAVAVAVRVPCPVVCAREVLDIAGLDVEQPEPEKQVAQFRSFLDTVTPDDFQTGPGDEGRG